MLSKLKIKANNLPEKPGVYIMKDENNSTIYIGKAKVLKNRVSQYFSRSRNNSQKVESMISKINDFEYIVTDSEFESLVLECSLIKKYKPKYNILLKDDKGYNYIKITNEDWPKILYVKKKLDDKCIYFGPYMSSFKTKKFVQEVNSIFKLPTCKRNFSKQKTRPCLNYYINKCIAPCYYDITLSDYKSLIDESILFIKNGKSDILKRLKKEMLESSESLNFEKAANIRDKIKSIESIVNDKQKVISDKIKNKDVISMAINGFKVSFYVFRFEGGELYDTDNFIVDFFDDEVSLRTEFVKRYYDMKEKIPSNIILDGEIENVELIKKWIYQTKNKETKILIPSRGEQFKLIQMCKQNAYESFEFDHREDTKYYLELLKEMLSIEKIPTYIESYDISNLQGKENVGGMVVFYNMEPLKSAYRRFKIKSVEYQDDYGSMKEMIFRRIKNYKKNKNNKNNSFSRLPDLILVDGGIVHTRVVKEVLKSEGIRIPVFGMVKDKNHKTRALTTDKLEIDIKNEKIFDFIEKIQNEVHRYTISYHRLLRNKNLFGSKSSIVLKKKKN